MTAVVDRDFPYDVILTDWYQIGGYNHRKGDVFTVADFDNELDAYVTKIGRMIDRKVAVRATPELIEAAERDEAARKARMEARQKAWEENRRVEQVINSAPANPYTDNPLFGLF
ncbi:MAG: hypothetical protein EOQ56_28355 [Mesorhizobium sp.]|nr:MAG: hypothetical protein EOQ56_28355 [Mesorhizobium sp.]